jgi:hypothetical protein
MDFPCPTCNRIFTSKRGCNQHRRLKHGDNISSSASEISGTESVGKVAASNIPKSVKQASSIASSSSATCDWCQGKFKSTSGVHLHKLKCKKQPEDKSVDTATASTASSSHQSPAFLSSLDKEDNTKGKHLDKFFASMQIAGTPDTKL